MRPGPGERSYHIFYQLLSGGKTDLKKRLKLKSPEDYGFLAHSGNFTVDNHGGQIDDRQEFEEMKQAMTEIGLGKEEQNGMFDILAAVLHIGNIDFEATMVNGTDGTKINKSNKKALTTAATILQVQPADLERVLVTRKLTVDGKLLDVPQNMEHALTGRDALAKSLYARLFDYLVGRVNDALEEGKEEGGSLDEEYIIGVLDIYGFEIFKTNGFEQFCINYVNEKLQQIFIELTLKAEQQEYKREGIAWKPITYFDNKIVCKLVEGKKPPGVMLVLDDTCKTMHAMSDGVDEKFLQKVRGVHSGHKHFFASSGQFRVKHYAGDVDYRVLGFCAANKDTLYVSCLDRLLQINPSGLCPGVIKCNVFIYIYSA